MASVCGLHQNEPHQEQLATNSASLLLLIRAATSSFQSECSTAIRRDATNFSLSVHAANIGTFTRLSDSETFNFSET